jgi:recombination protein RecR
MESIERLAEMFIRFPGIGPRQARRFVYFVMRQDAGWIDAFIRELTQLRAATTQCTACRRRFMGATKAERTCPTCADTSRSNETLMIVEKEVDFETVEKSRAYSGRYFILGGTISPLEEDRAEPMVHALCARIEAMTQAGLSEVVLALSATSEGDDTAEYLHQRISPLAQKHPFALTMLGRGLSTGSEIEYADTKTLKDALSRRTKLD